MRSHALDERWGDDNPKGALPTEVLGSIRVLAYGVRRPRERHVAATRLTVLAEQGFPAGRRKVARGDACAPQTHRDANPSIRVADCEGTPA